MNLTNETIYIVIGICIIAMPTYDIIMEIIKTHKRIKEAGKRCRIAHNIEKLAQIRQNNTFRP